MMALENYDRRVFYFPEENQEESIDFAQKIILDFFTGCGNLQSIEQAIFGFTLLCIKPFWKKGIEIQQALQKIVKANNENIFRQIIKKSFFTVLNSLDGDKRDEFIQEFTNLFSESNLNHNSASLFANRLKVWTNNFARSTDYQEIGLFASQNRSDLPEDWSLRYASHLLTAQYMDIKNPPEQREAARIRAQQLREKFKFDLAMYVAYAQSAKSVLDRKKIPNPTLLGDRTLIPIKLLLLKRGEFDEETLANLFLKQTRNQIYRDFKVSFSNYLTFRLGNLEAVDPIAQALTEKLHSLYLESDLTLLNSALLLRTCKQGVDLLAMDEAGKPSPLLISLLSQGNLLVPARFFARLLLICPSVRSHLEYRIAQVIQTYAHLPPTHCQWLINFLEVLNIVLAIYTDNVKYNLIQLDRDRNRKNSNSVVDLNTYRVFSHYQGLLEDDSTFIPARSEG